MRAPSGRDFHFAAYNITKTVTDTGDIQLNMRSEPRWGPGKPDIHDVERNGSLVCNPVLYIQTISCSHALLKKTGLFQINAVLFDSAHSAASCSDVTVHGIPNPIATNWSHDPENIFVNCLEYNAATHPLLVLKCFLGNRRKCTGMKADVFCLG
jgi:hypothetical protein